MSSDGVEYRAARVSSVTALSIVAAVAFKLVSVPICLKFWGTQSYGQWLSIFAGYLLVRSLDSGFINYVGNELNRLYHEDLEALREHLASALAGFTVLASLQIAIGLAALQSPRLASVFGVGGDAHGELALPMLVMVVAWALTGSYLGLVHRLLIPTGLMYQSAWWGLAFKAAQFAALVLAAMLRLEMLQAALLYAVFQAAFYWVCAAYIRFRLPAFFPWWRGIRPRTGLKDLSRSLFLTASDFIQEGTASGAVVLVSSLSGPAAVSVFATSRTLATLWTNITTMFTSPLLPDVVRYHAKAEARKLVDVCVTHSVLVATSVNLSILLAFPLVAPAYTQWTARRLTLDEPLLCALLAVVVLRNMSSLISLYLSGINRVGVVLAASAIRGAVGLAAGAALIGRIGLPGLGLGLVLGETIAVALLVFCFARSSLVRQEAGLKARPFAPMLLSNGLTLSFLAGRFLGWAVYRHVYWAALAGVLLAAIWGWRSLEPEVKARLTRMVRSKLPGR